jgi:hypothetical protein
LRPFDCATDDRYAFLDRNHCRTGQNRTGLFLLPSSFRKHPEYVATAHDLPHHAHGLSVGLAAPHR